MKKRIMLFILAVSISGYLYGQDSTWKPNTEIYLVIDKNTVIPLDSLSNDKIHNDFNPKWIKKMTLLKDEKYKYIYGDTGGKLLIYIKKRYKNKLLEYHKDSIMPMPEKWF